MSRKTLPDRDVRRPPLTNSTASPRHAILPNHAVAEPISRASR